MSTSVQEQTLSSRAQSMDTQTYAIDQAHTTVGFSIRHLMISKVRGRFGSFSGSLAIPAGSNVPERIEVSIDAASIDTREPQRDDHLRSADFFDVATYPNLTFRSTKVSGTQDAFDVEGDLTIHGVTRPVVLHATFEGRGNDPWGNHRVGFEAHATINRKDFGLGWNQALEAGGVLVGDEVKIELGIETTAQK